MQIRNLLFVPRRREFMPRLFCARGLPRFTSSCQPGSNEPVGPCRLAPFANPLPVFLGYSCWELHPRRTLSRFCLIVPNHTCLGNRPLRSICANNSRSSFASSVPYHVWYRVTSSLSRLLARTPLLRILPCPGDTLTPRLFASRTAAGSHHTSSH